MSSDDGLDIPDFLRRSYDPNKRLPRVGVRHFRQEMSAEKAKRDRRLPQGWQMPKGGIEPAGWELLRKIVSGELARTEAQRAAERDARLAALRNRKGQ